MLLDGKVKVGSTLVISQDNVENTNIFKGNVYPSLSLTSHQKL